MPRRPLRVVLVALALAGFAVACEGEAERTFYGAGDAADASDMPDRTAVLGDGSVESGAEGGGGAFDATVDAPADVVDGHAAVDSAADSAIAVDSAADGTVPTDSAAEASIVDGGSDAAFEAGCGPLDTPANCGACGTACDSTHSVDAGCTGAACTYSGCDPGYGDCDAGPPDTNGCETRLDSITNCTGCGIACDGSHSHDAGCAGTGCTYGGCDPGYADCDGGPPNRDGCETPTTTLGNCGGCGVACGGPHTTDAGCAPSGCVYACAPGWNNCNTANPNTAGCECNTPSCCGDGGPGACQTTHATGLPNLPYYDCNPVATGAESQSKLVVQALEACAAFTGNVGQCATGLTCPASPRVGPYVCDGNGGINCTTCWSYGGTDVLTTEDCSCPPGTTNIGPWN